MLSFPDHLGWTVEHGVLTSQAVLRSAFKSAEETGSSDNCQTQFPGTSFHSEPQNDNQGYPPPSQSNQENFQSRIKECRRQRKSSENVKIYMSSIFGQIYVTYCNHSRNNPTRQRKRC